MEQRISLVTFGVKDLSRARTFYEQLGWRGQVEETVFFQAGGMALVLWGADKLAADTGIGTSSNEGFREMNLAQNVRSKADVDPVIAAAESAGGTITRPPGDTFYGGYAGYFTDPDGHAWAIAYNHRVLSVERWLAHPFPTSARRCGPTPGNTRRRSTAIRHRVSECRTQRRRGRIPDRARRARGNAVHSSSAAGATRGGDSRTGPMSSGTSARPHWQCATYTRGTCESS